MTRKPVITVIGKSARNPGDPVPARALRAGEEVGKLLAERGAVVVTGGLSGVMEAVSRGAKNAGGLVIGILWAFLVSSYGPLNGLTDLKETVIQTIVVLIAAIIGAAAAIALFLLAIMKS